jgi:hypothetical protein
MIVVAVAAYLAVMYKFVPEAHEYFIALLSYTFTLAAGCTATVMLGLIQKYVLKTPLTPKAEVAIFLAFVFFAGFEAWRDQHQVFVEAKANLEALSQPQLNGDGLVLASTPIGSNGEDTLMIISGVIKNKGASTILQNWRVEMELPNGSRRIGQLVDIQQDIITFQGSNPEITTAKLPASSWWPRRSVNQSVPPGGSLPGWIAAKFKGITNQELVSQRIKFFLFYQDINGKEWVTEEDTIHGPRSNPNISQQELEIELRQSHPELQNNKSHPK